MKNVCSAALIAAIGVIALASAGGVEEHSMAQQPPQLPAEIDSVMAQSDFGMVAAGSSEGARAGIDILERGGNAIDAAIAATLAQSVADADALGLGGMTYMLVRLADGHTTVLDGSSPAPLKVNLNQLKRIRQRKSGQFSKGYKFVSTPTTLATLELARKRYGTMEMAELINPAVELAETGYRLSALQIIWSNKYIDDILHSRYLSHMMLDEGKRIGAQGTVYCRPDLATTLRRIAAEGVESFYRGPLAAEIIDDIQSNKGFLRRSDLMTLRVPERAPARTRYRGTEVFTFPAPGGGPLLVEILSNLEKYPSAFIAEDSVERHHVLIETFRLARAGSNLQQLASSPHGRFGSIAGQTDTISWVRPEVVPGKMIPESQLGPEPDPDCVTPIGDSTTHLSVIDHWGNVVSMTSTLGRSFGACVATPGLGFPYNNFLEFYNYEKPHCPSYLQPRTLCPTDMAPTIVVEDGMVKVALGAPGSNRIPSILTNLIVNMVDRGLDLHDAMEVPRIVWGGQDGVNLVQLEMVDPIDQGVFKGLEKIGFDKMLRLDFPGMAEYVVIFGGINSVAWDPEKGTFVGVSDRRRTGFAGGPRAVANPQQLR